VERKDEKYGVLGLGGDLDGGSHADLCGARCGILSGSGDGAAPLELVENRDHLISTP